MSPDPFDFSEKPVLDQVGRRRLAGSLRPAIVISPQSRKARSRKLLWRQLEIAVPGAWDRL